MNKYRVTWIDPKNTRKLEAGVPLHFQDCAETSDFTREDLATHFAKYQSSAAYGLEARLFDLIEIKDGPCMGNFMLDVDSMLIFHHWEEV